MNDANRRPIIGILFFSSVFLLIKLFFLKEKFGERFQKIENELETLKAIMEIEEKRRENARRIAEEKPEFAEAYKAIGLL